MLVNSPVSYEDEFGEIGAEVLREAELIWHYCRSLSIKILGDEHEGQRLLMQAAAKVSLKYKSGETEIKHLRSYLWISFRNLLLAEAKKNERHRELEEKYFETLSSFLQGNARSEEDRVCRRILMEEIVSKMDKWTRDVYEYLALGYKYKDLVPKYGPAENSIRMKFSRNLKKIAGDI